MTEMTEVAPPPVASLLVVLLLLGTAACSNDGAYVNPKGIDVDGATVPTRVFLDALTGLCHARVQVSTDPARARATFFGRSHDALHRTVRALEGLNLEKSARLAEIKARVEDELTAQPPPPHARDDLGKLAETTRDGLARLGIATSPCKE